MRNCFLLLMFLLTPPLLQAQTTAVKKVLLEEFTTTLCGVCPPKTHQIVSFYEAHTANAVFMEHHAGFGVDSMTNSSANTFANYFRPSTFGFAPAIMIDRDVYPWVDSVPYMSVNGFDSIASRVMQDTALVAVDLVGSYNPLTRLLDLTTTATFLQSLPSGDWRINLFFVEDSVTGAGNGWDQKCYDAAFANLYYPGQYNSSTTYISNYPHRYVQRGPLTGGTWGPSGIIPATPVAGVPYTLTISQNVPANLNDQRLRVVAFVALYGANKFERQALNANDVKLSQLTPTAIHQLSQEQKVTLFPNPAKETTTLRSGVDTYDLFHITITDLAGKVVQQQQWPGYHPSIPINCASLNDGIYLINLQHSKGSHYLRLVVSH